jgi:hypothetical protein
LAVENLKRVRRWRPLVLVLIGLTAVPFLVMAVVDTPWFAIGVAGCGWLLVMAWNAPRRVQKRIDLLGEEAGTGAAATPSK